jgi:hypothetical protein
MTSKSLYDHHIARLACVRAVHHTTDPATEHVRGTNGAWITERFFANQTWE